MAATAVKIRLNQASKQAKKSISNGWVYEWKCIEPDAMWIDKKICNAQHIYEFTKELKVLKWE